MLFRIGAILTFWNTVRLAWRLMRDGRVPFYLKMVSSIALLYMVSPVGLMLNFIPVLGQLDDLTAVMLAILLFVRLCPKDLVREHRETMAGKPRPRDPVAPEKVIDGEYKILD